jgi:ArsR family transcriptional regulator
MNMESSWVVAALAALAHEGRLNIFRMLAEAESEGLPAGELARRLGIAPNTLSAHLKILGHAGLIAGRRRSQSIIYRAQTGQMAALLGHLSETCQFNRTLPGSA